MYCVCNAQVLIATFFNRHHHTRLDRPESGVIGPIGLDEATIKIPDGTHNFNPDLHFLNSSL
jgi:hypothetical protein